MPVPLHMVSAGPKDDDPAIVSTVTESLPGAMIAMRCPSVERASRSPLVAMVPVVRTAFAPSIASMFLAESLAAMPFFDRLAVWHPLVPSFG